MKTFLLPEIASDEERAGRRQGIVEALSRPRPKHPYQIASVKLQQFVDVDDFFALLNSDAADAKPTVPANVQPLQGSDFSESVLLRRWVDEWINSGYVNGSDDPRTRQIKSTNTSAALSVFTFQSLGGLVLSLNNTGNGVSLLIPEQPWSTKGNDPDELKVYAAARLFAVMLLSDLKYDVAKCRDTNCAKYFLLKQPGRSYPRGTLCSRCSRQKRSLAATKIKSKSRRNAAKQLHEHVVRRYSWAISENSSWHKDAELKKSIAKFLNKIIRADEELSGAYPGSISGKWVAHPKNWVKINKMASGKPLIRGDRKHA